MPVSLFENKPEYCPFGHQLWPGEAQVSWTPCICEPAREAAGRGRGMGHVQVTCNRCHDQFRQTVFYERHDHHGLAGVGVAVRLCSRRERCRRVRSGQSWRAPGGRSRKSRTSCRPGFPAHLIMSIALADLAAR